MQEILKANDKSNKLYILDARPKINAMTNVVRIVLTFVGKFLPSSLPFLLLLSPPPLFLSLPFLLLPFPLPPLSLFSLSLSLSQAMGGGYEHEDCYVNMDFSFLDIGNIHVMRERLENIRHTIHLLVLSLANLICLILLFSN